MSSSLTRYVGALKSRLAAGKAGAAEEEPIVEQEFGSSWYKGIEANRNIVYIVFPVLCPEEDDLNCRHAARFVKYCNCYLPL